MNCLCYPLNLRTYFTRPFIIFYSTYLDKGQMFELGNTLIPF